MYDLGGDPFGRAGAGQGAGLLVHRHHGRVLRRPGAARRAVVRVRAPAADRTRWSGSRSSSPRPPSASPASSRSTPRCCARSASGSGAAAGSRPVTCETCHGRGEVQHVQRSFLGEIRTLRPCAACRGYGEIIPDPCRECSGDGRVRSRRSLTVKIPAGVDTGTRVQLAGEGEVGPGGGPAGDLYVEIHVAHAPGLHPRRHRPALPRHRADDGSGARYDDPAAAARGRRGRARDSDMELWVDLEIQPGTQSGTETDAARARRAPPALAGPRRHGRHASRWRPRRGSTSGRRSCCASSPRCATRSRPTARSSRRTSRVFGRLRDAFNPR